MDTPIDTYWSRRLEALKAALESNNFEAHLASTPEEAGRIIMDEILPATGAVSASWGGSITFQKTGVMNRLEHDPALQFINPFGTGLSPDESLELRRRSLTVDLFLTGTNAITETGHLVNLDRTGNRVAAITFGPKHVVVCVGRNKIVPDLDQAMFRIKDYAAPLTAARIGAKTPCVKTSLCEDCASPGRVCNYWAITERSYPKGRIKVLLIDQDMGF